MKGTERSKKTRHEGTKRTKTHEGNELAWITLRLVAPRCARSAGREVDGSQALHEFCLCL